MEKMPLVSILLLSMNHERYVEQCISSIVQQSYKNLEIVYVDNASTDNTFLKAKKIIESSGFPFRCFNNTISKNISQNFNFLLSISTGSLISPLSTDDWFERENIERKVEHFLKNKEVGVVFSNGWIFNETEKTTILNDPTNFKRGNIYNALLTQPDCIFYVGVMYKREIIEKVGKWDETLIIEDTDLYVRLSLVTKFDYLPIPLVYYRRTSSSASKNKKFMIKGFRQYYEKYKYVEWVNMRAWLSDKYRSMAASCVDEGEFKDARNFLIKAIAINPIEMQNFRTLFYLIRKSFQKS